MHHECIYGCGQPYTCCQEDGVLFSVISVINQGFNGMLCGLALKRHTSARSIMAIKFYHLSELALQWSNKMRPHNITAHKFGK